ncbi:Membrane-bound lytic murein transglycosylase A precursor [Serratia grimesii]|nr:Membrane-bound lytic murein transglycosylase A precursor [Serratia grimesii]
MKGRWGKYLLGGLVVAVLAGCSSKPTDRGQQYKDGRLEQSLELVNQPNAKGVPVNARDYADQLMEIKNASPSLFNRNNTTFQAVQSWMASGADTRNLNQYGLSAYQMEGVDNYGNVQFTGYYTPVLQARYTQQGEFRYPLYRMPPKGKGRLPDRAGIYSGALDDRYIVAYTNSLNGQLYDGSPGQWLCGLWQWSAVGVLRLWWQERPRLP